MGTGARFIVSLALAMGVLVVAGFFVEEGQVADVRDEAPRRSGKREDEIDYRSALRSRQPEVVLIGNSFLGRAVDRKVFEEETGLETVSIHHGGAATAMYYLILKNVVARAEPRPKAVVLFYRDVYLTEPEFRVIGPFRRRLERYAEPEEPELERIAYGHGQDRFQDLLQNWPLHRERERLKSEIEGGFKRGLVELVTGRKYGDVLAAVERTFAEEAMEQRQVDEAQFEADLALDSEHHFDFDLQLPRSFLPLLIELSEENEMRLILVRLPTRWSTFTLTETPARQAIRDRAEWMAPRMEAYDRALRLHAELFGVPLVDLSRLPEIRMEHFERGDHLNDQGRARFTPILARELASQLSF